MTGSEPTLRERLKDFPTSPGVYLMKDRDGAVVYVGKAANLRVRLRQYFAEGTSDTRFFVSLLDRVLGDIEVVVTRTAGEALLVENELIKTHQPRFNIKLKDDKAFLNLRLSTTHAFPRLDVVRKRQRDGARYFGPYPSATAIRSTLRFINRYFQLRTCTDREMQNRSRPCLEYQIKRCPAPCVLDVPKAQYDASVRRVALFLDGRGEELVGELREAMSEAASAMDFEKAARLRDQATAVERCQEEQVVVLDRLTDLDIFGLAREGALLAVHVHEIRGGRIVRAEGTRLGRQEVPDAVALTEFVTRRYAERHAAGERPPPEIVLPLPIDDLDFWAEYLTELRGAKVRVAVPQRGEKRELVDLANRNAQESLRLDVTREEHARKTLRDLEQRLRLGRFPERIECYDISNIQGTDPVASMVVFQDGVPAPSEYRHFHIRSLRTPNDFEMMYETLKRRFARMQSGEWQRPDLVVIDGGKGQLGIATRVLHELGVTGLDVVGLAKSRVIDDDQSAAPERSDERVFVPGLKDPIVLAQNSAPLLLLTRLRDEAHRFAVTFHQRTRDKKRLTSSLESIEGVGPARRKALLGHFGSMAALKRATADAVAAVSGIGPELAARIVAALNEAS